MSSKLSALLAVPTVAELRAFSNLCRLSGRDLNGFWAIWAPTAWSVFMAYHTQDDISIQAALRCLALYIPLCNGIQSLMMAIDDILDHDIDALVSRTRHRPIPRGAISLPRAWLFFFIQAAIGIYCARIFLSPSSLRLSMLTWPVIIIYPTLKRWTNLAPIPLGVMFNIGTCMGWSDVSASSRMDWSITLPLYIAGCLWTICYETIYQHQDRAEDEKLGLYSMARLFGEWTIPLCMASGMGFFAILGFLGTKNGLGFPFFAAILVAGWQVSSRLSRTDINNPGSCKEFFLCMPLISQLVLGGIVADAISHRLLQGIPLFKINRASNACARPSIFGIKKIHSHANRTIAPRYEQWVRRVERKIAEQSQPRYLFILWSHQGIGHPSIISSFWSEYPGRSGGKHFAVESEEAVTSGLQVTSDSSMADILVPMSAADVGTPATVEILQQILAAKYFFVATLTMLLYDHILTFPSEVSYFDVELKLGMTFRTGANCLEKEENIHFTVLPGRSVLCSARHDSRISRLFCNYNDRRALSTLDTFPTIWYIVIAYRVARYSHALEVRTPAVASFHMVVEPTASHFRVYALYNRSKLIFAGLSTFLLAQTAAGIWQGTVPGGTPVPDPVNNYEFHICLYAPPVKIAIFSMNLTWVIMIFQAPPGLRDIAAMPASCVTTVMICRITLNLRTTAYGPPQLDERTENPNDIPLSKLRSLRSPRAAASQAASAVLPVVSPSILQIGRKDAENSEEGNGWRLSGPLDISQSMRKVDPDP
ncbi:hypothetical protein EVG20_g4603 [Dentipellis fragilis]|uniref:DUF6533 domain-containing protein n=1 Tax=Dentipellis fragilis TaxID=205917 RepID=A0A4Y9YXL5_9AGAM|nr:hypothetical protein EVG20_g4603 [Dentipellis fragilis]